MALTDKEIKALRGLEPEAASELLRTSGYNELPAQKKRGIIKIALGVFKEPMFLLLVVCGAVYLFLGDLEESVMLLGFVFFIIGITIYQEGKTENALNALRDLSSPRALVIRGGERARIPGREVVPGDHVILEEGDRIPADGVLVWGVNFSVDESLLTGESIPVRKEPGEVSGGMAEPGGDGLSSVFSGSMVVTGQGLACIINTGTKTEMGRIGKSLSMLEQEDTPLQKETGRIVKTVFIIAAACCIVVVLMYGFTRNDWLSGVLSGITLAMAMLPEEFPVVLTIFLALGAWRISQKNVLARKISAVETLGAATVLCVDKTGTLTENRMSIRKVFAAGNVYDIKASEGAGLPETFHELIEFGILASRQDPFDPMEKALQKLGREKLMNTEHLHRDWSLIREYSLSKELLSLSHAWHIGYKEGYVISAKGAPEAILDLCHFDDGQRGKLLLKVLELAGEGLRVIGIAKAVHAEKDLPKEQHSFDFKFIGFIGLEDPVRKSVPTAVSECYRAGIRIVMITGDYPETAKSIGRQIGLRNPEVFISGQELKTLTPAQLAERVRETNIFARVVPDQKLLIVEAFKAAGEVVAMTGDGVNDAPALKAAFIGISMGERGTDVAREASDLVLLKDDFSSVVEAVKVGRRIFDNLRKAMAYIVSVHIPIALLSLIPVLFRWEALLLFPVHIVFLELIIDPTCSVVFENEPAEKHIMDRKPRNPKEPLFGKKTMLISSLQGLVSFCIVMAVYFVSKQLGEPMAETRTLCFMTLVASNLLLVMTNRSWTDSVFASFKVKNASLTWVAVSAVAFILLVIYVPFLQKLFSFTAMKAQDFLIALLAGALAVLWFEVVKWVALKYRFNLLNERVAQKN